jgi:prepilin-type N-terminal cleavage/methylation domain-containing protein
MTPQTKNANNLRFNRQSAFTLIELMISLGLFSMVIVVITSLFIQTVKAERLVTNRVAAIDNVALAIEQIAREIRTGVKFKEQGNKDGIETDELEFTNDNAERVRYRLNNGAIEKSVGGDDDFLPITSSSIEIDKLVFRIMSEPGNFPPRITVIIRAKGPKGLFELPLNLETTIDARLIYYQPEAI